MVMMYAGNQRAALFLHRGGTGNQRLCTAIADGALQGEEFCVPDAF